MKIIVTRCDTDDMVVTVTDILSDVERYTVRGEGLVNTVHMATLMTMIKLMGLQE